MHRHRWLPVKATWKDGGEPMRLEVFWVCLCGVYKIIRHFDANSGSA